MLSPYKMCMHQLYSPPQLKHQYIDYTNGSSIAFGQKIHVDFDYGNGIGRTSLGKAVFCIECHLSIPIHKMYGKKSPFCRGTYIVIPLVKVLSDGGDEVQYQGFRLIFDIDGASSIKIFTLLSIFVQAELGLLLELKLYPLALDIK